KKPPVGQGLNKPAEVTLLNIKCSDKKSGKHFTEGRRVEKYTEMLKRKAEDQGAEFVSYDPIKGEWKFRPVGGNVQISKTVMMVQIVDLKKELLNLRSSL
nr:nuclear pore complex protein NUP98A isoform X1 [Tanacetum cinerariifolium]